MQAETFYVDPANITPDPNHPQQNPQQENKKHPLRSILIALIILASLGLNVFFQINKLKAPETVDETAVIPPISTPLSKINQDMLADALAGRSFTVDKLFDQSLTFTDSTHYTFSYYRQESDQKTLPASTESGTFTISENTITLSGGDSFTVSGDYLIKASDQLSANKNAIYFDSLQLASFSRSFASALTAHINKQLLSGEDENPATAKNFKKAQLDHFSCAFDQSRMTNADNFVCATSYTRLFANDIKDTKSNNFIIRLQKPQNSQTSQISITGEFEETSP